MSSIGERVTTVHGVAHLYVKLLDDAGELRADLRGRNGREVEIRFAVDGLRSGLGALGLEHGGMGAVYLAERVNSDFKQKVALKIIKRGMDSEAILKRFAIERKILSRLTHPNIAKLFDAGVAEAGQPYLVLIEKSGAVPHPDGA